MTSPLLNSFDLDRIRSETFVQSIEFYDQLNSTNDEALRVCAEDYLEPPFLVLTERQTAGRGRRSNQWWAATGALTMSLVLDPTDLGFSQNVWPQMSLTFGLAVCDTLAKRMPNANVGLKWPNDVHLNGRKVSGVLVEVSAQSTERLVVGIGLNVNNSFCEAPDALRPLATSVIDEVGGPTDLTDWLVLLLNQLNTLLDRLRDNPSALGDEWGKRCVLKGQSVRIEAGDVATEGCCEGIDAEGALLVKTDRGLQRLFGGTVVSSISDGC